MRTGKYSYRCEGAIRYIVVQEGGYAAAIGVARKVAGAVSKT